MYRSTEGWSDGKTHLSVRNGPKMRLSQPCIRPVVSVTACLGGGIRRSLSLPHREFPQHGGGAVVMLELTPTQTLLNYKAELSRSCCQKTVSDRAGKSRSRTP